MSAPRRPCQRCGPWWIVGQVRLCAASEEQFNHVYLAEFGCPPQRRRTDVLVTGMQIGSVLKEDRCSFDVALPGELVQRGNAQPVGVAGVHTMLEEQLVFEARPKIVSDDQCTFGHLRKEPSRLRVTN